MAVRALHELEQTDRKKGHGAMEQDEKQKAVKALLANHINADSKKGQ